MEGRAQRAITDPVGTNRQPLILCLLSKEASEASKDGEKQMADVRIRVRIDMLVRAV